MEYKEIKAWGIVVRKNLTIFDGRVPIYWKKDVATKQNEENLSGIGRVIPVKISYVLEK